MKNLCRSVLLSVLVLLFLQPAELFVSNASAAAVPQTAAKNRKKAKRKMKKQKVQKIKVLKGHHGKHHSKPA